MKKIILIILCLVSTAFTTNIRTCNFCGRNIKRGTGYEVTVRADNQTYGVASFYPDADMCKKCYVKYVANCYEVHASTKGVR